MDMLSAFLFCVQEMQFVRITRVFVGCFFFFKKGTPQLILFMLGLLKRQTVINFCLLKGFADTKTILDLNKVC